MAETVADAWRAGGGELTAYRARDGNFQVRAVRSDGRHIWVPAALDFAGQIEILGNTEAWQGNMPAPFLVEGVGLGWLVPKLHAATEQTFLTYSAALYIVETNLRTGAGITTARLVGRTDRRSRLSLRGAQSLVAVEGTHAAGAPA